MGPASPCRRHIHGVTEWFVLGGTLKISSISTLLALLPHPFSHPCSHLGITSSVFWAPDPHPEASTAILGVSSSHKHPPLLTELLQRPLPCPPRNCSRKFSRVIPGLIKGAAWRPRNLLRVPRAALASVSARDKVNSGGGFFSQGPLLDRAWSKLVSCN